jgi:hypothetical protein
MQLINFEKLFDICKEFSENHEKYGFCEFDFQIIVYNDRRFHIEFEFCVVGAVPVYIVPDSEESTNDWFICSSNWMDEKGKQTIINWILENKEVFSLKTLQ